MKKHLSKLSFLVIGLSLAATVSYLNAWTGPTETAPAGNVGAPVNLSALSQIKLGGLSVASLLSTGAIGASQYCDALGQNCSTPPFGGSSVPAGTVAAFNLTTCPAGWIPADGTNGTRDLRGIFVRGMESFNGGTTASSSDPDRTGSATLGSYQADMYASHAHGYNMAYNAGGIADAYARADLGVFYLNQGASTGGAGGNETRPKNVALLYCQKDLSSSGGGSSSSSILANGDSSTNTRYNDYTVNLTSSGILTMSNSYCGNNSGGQITDAKIYVDGELIGYSRVGNACGWYTDCPTITSTTAQKTLSAGTHTLRSECYVPAGTGIIHKSSYVVVK